MHGPIGWMHLYSALAALATGTFIVVLPKGTPLHRIAGLSYVLAILILNASALSLYNMTGYFGPFHALALVSLFCTLMGLAAPLLKRPNWIARHVRWMARSYLGLIAAAVAESLVRIPALHVNTAARGFEIGIGAAVFMSIVIVIVMPRLRKAAEKFETAKVKCA